MRRVPRAGGNAGADAAGGGYDDGLVHELPSGEEGQRGLYVLPRTAVELRDHYVAHALVRVGPGAAGWPGLIPGQVIPGLIPVVGRLVSTPALDHG